MIGTLGSSWLFALESTRLQLNTLGVNDGLADKAVRAITQDNEGYIWIGTEHGISRFDGINITNIVPTKKNNMSGGYIRALAFDKSGLLWIATAENGLNQYSTVRQTFSSFKTVNSSIRSNNTNALAVDRDVGLWVGTDGGLDFYNFEMQAFESFKSGTLDSSGLIDKKVRSLLLTEDNQLWIGTQNGLGVLNADRSKTSLIQFPQLEQPRIYSLTQDNQGTVWIATNKGLYSYLIKDKELQHHSVSGQSVILTVLASESGDLWIGTLKNGVHRIAKDGRVSYYVEDKGDSKSIRDIGLLSLFEDRSGSLWMGTYNAGIQWFDPTTLTLGAHDKTLSSFPCLPSDITFSALPYAESEILVGTTGGLTRLNLQTRKCQNFSHNTTLKSTIAGNQVFAIYQARDKSLWAGTSGGLDELNNQSLKVTRHISELSKRDIHTINESTSGSLIVGTDAGVYTSDVEKKSFSSLARSTEISRARIYVVTQDEDNNYWIGTDNGLFVYDHKFKKLVFRYRDPEIDFNTHIRSIHLISKTTALITIEGRGLFKLNRENQLLKSQLDYYGLSSTFAYAGLHQDSQNNLWLMTTNNGLFQLAPNKPGSVHYNYKNGLISNYVMARSAINMPDGNVFFGSREGFSLFDPAQLKKNLKPAEVTISQLLIHEKKIRPFLPVNGFQIEKPLADIKSILLKHKNNGIGFEFTAFHHTSPKANRFKYKLEGVNQNWIDSDANSNRVSYDDLSAGNYQFRVKAASSNGIWSQEKELAITILPAPWLTWWAFLIYLVVVLLLVVSVFQYRTRVIRQRATSLEEIVTQRTIDLSKEKNKVEQLLAIKNQEFANVSHEFRTPLTLMLGPLRQTLEEVDEPNINRRLKMIQRNGYRLLRMVDQLLNMETFRVKAITQRQPQDAGVIISRLCEAFFDLANEKNITLTFNIVDDVTLEFTNDALEKIVLNLLSNALKYSNSGSAINLVCQRTSDNDLLIRVEDQGVGIPEHEIEKVFERYHRVLNEKSEQVTGAGIGLALVKELVEAHGGAIYLQSEVNVGTQVSIKIPIIAEHNKVQTSQPLNEEVIVMELMSLNHQHSLQTTDCSIDRVKVEEHNVSQPVILVIEDNADMRDYLIESLSQHYKVLSAVDGEEGLKIAIDEVPDLIISDVMMPKMDGYQTTHALRKNAITNHIPIILLTARGDRQSRLKGWHEKADEYLTKPFDNEELRIRVNNLLDIRKILRKRFAEAVFEIENKIPELNATESAELSVAESSEKLQQEFVLHFNSALQTLYKKPSTTVAQFASAIAMSERQIFRKVKNVLDMTPKEYIRRYRLEKAKKLLQQGETTSAIAYDVGFSSQSYFGKCFKAQYGVSPSEYRSRDAE